MMISHDGSADPIHQKLRKVVEKPIQRYLWTPADMITFTPALLPVFYGDGRALFQISTINQRPRYWIIRGCSTWGCGYDGNRSTGPDFAELTDDLLTDLEEAFGNGRCGYSDNSLFWPRKERLQFCQSEQCDEKRWKARWPMVDGSGGSSWSRIDWPDSFDTMKNPLSWRGNLLAPANQPAVAA
ncbi:MAG TPA: hypothetical protein P5256_06360 [Beijerinckiaceae bacterium]|nr:hypothetical protein [Rhodoblastus sp.]MCC2106133.1 hypothetical protein [Hyphomicrobiales bacterium]HPG02919.1 hypothetical protein [Rhodoblastus sp.]HRY02726.1 hypothetical protein [Beijerinckiaceae bacterium]